MLIFISLESISRSLYSTKNDNKDAQRFQYKYVLGVVQVCRKTFQDTLAITYKRIKGVNSRRDRRTGRVRALQRGKRKKNNNQN